MDLAPFVGEEQQLVFKHREAQVHILRELGGIILFIEQASVNIDPSSGNKHLFAAESYHPSDRCDGFANLLGGIKTLAFIDDEISAAVWRDELTEPVGKYQVAPVKLVNALILDDHRGHHHKQDQNQNEHNGDNHRKPF